MGFIISFVSLKRLINSNGYYMETHTGDWHLRGAEIMLRFGTGRWLQRSHLRYYVLFISKG